MIDNFYSLNSSSVFVLEQLALLLFLYVYLSVLCVFGIFPIEGRVIRAVRLVFSFVFTHIFLKWVCLLLELYALKMIDWLRNQGCENLMASSQVEYASSAPFGCVLRDHNRSDRYRDNNARNSFQKNLKNLVTGHLHSCIGISSGSVSEANSRTQNENVVDSWVGNGERNNHRSLGLTINNNHSNNYRDDSSIMSSRQTQILERWATRQEQEMGSTNEQQSQQAELLELSNCPTVLSRESSSRREDSPDPSVGSAEIPNLGASSLVQIWEKRLNKSQSMKLISATSVQEPSIEAGDSVEERYDARPIDDPFPDWESDKTAPIDPPSSSQGGNSDAGESERVRVVDIIKRLTSAKQTQSPKSSCSDDNDHEQSSMLGSPGRERECSSLPDHVEYRVPQVISPRIRGRQAFTDLLMQLERDRHKELDTLAERRAVSKFAQKGRIQVST